MLELLITVLVETLHKLDHTQQQIHTCRRETRPKPVLESLANNNRKKTVNKALNLKELSQEREQACYKEHGNSTRLHHFDNLQVVIRTKACLSLSLCIMNQSISTFPTMLVSIEETLANGFHFDTPHAHSNIATPFDSTPSAFVVMAIQTQCSIKLA